MPPRRRSAPEEAENPVVTEQAEAAIQTPEGEASPEETPQEEPEAKRRSRRKSSQTAAAQAAPVQIAEPAAAAEVDASEEEPASAQETQSLEPPIAVNQPAPPARQRSRSRKRSKAGEEPTPEAAPSPTPPESPTDAPVLAVTLEEPAAPEFSEDTPLPPVDTVQTEAGALPSEEADASVAPVRRRRRTRHADEAPPAEPSMDVEASGQRRQKREGVRLGVRLGHPEIIIDGKPAVPLFFFGNTESAAAERKVCEQIELAAAAGVHLHIVLLELPVSVALVSYSVNEALRLFHLVRQHDPQGYVMFRVVFSPPPDWQKLYPEAMTTYADGSTGEPSFASERYWQEAEAALTLLVRQLELAAESRYILGYQLDCREWFYEYRRGYDDSPAAQEAFRQWLRTRYKNDVVALRAAWHDGSVTFSTASVPTYRSETTTPTVLYEYRKGQRYVDYLRFASEVIARRIVALSRVVKKSCENRRLVAVPYGYLLEFAAPHSGHLSLSEVLSAQSIDIITAPISYRDRHVTQPGSVPVPVASVRLRGKVFLLEDDTKPHYAQSETPDDYNPRCADAESTRMVRIRNAMTALIHHAGIAWMDLWGEGWVQDAEVWQIARGLAELYTAHLRHRLAEQPEVAVIVDEHSLARVQSPKALVETLLIQQQEVLARAGIHYGVYLQSDLLRKAFPDARLYIFLNPIQVDSEVREAIRERLQRDGKTLVWLYTVALYDENGYTPDGPRDVAGIAIKAQPWNSETGSIISNDRHPITERLRNKTIGTRERINPTFYVLDERATVLGEYIQTGLPSIVVKDMGSWRSVFIGERHLSVDLLRGLCRFAGVHVWSQSSDVVRVSPPFVAVHSVGDGTLHLQLPAKQMVFDLTEWRLLAEEATNLRVNMRTGQSALYAVGGFEQLRALGIPVPERGEEIAVELPTSTGKKRRRRGGRKHRKKKE
jgi:hypothetical protein